MSSKLSVESVSGEPSARQECTIHSRDSVPSKLEAVHPRSQTLRLRGSRFALPLCLVWRSALRPRLTGIEFVGEAGYRQSWWCKAIA
jgi:hypothetical protein